jgi:hypothetical protein
MTRMALGFTLAAVLLMAGWTAGRAQTTEPDFVLVVETKVGVSAETTIRCVEGCGLTWIERGLNPNSSVMPQFTFRCTPPETCTSARVGGWLTR